jgi:hypothetical protein
MIIADLLRVVGAGGLAKVEGARLVLGMVELNSFLKSELVVGWGGAAIGEMGIAE